MELGATMELRGGRGSQLEVEDIPYIVGEKIQPLSTSSARDDARYYRGSCTGRNKPELEAVLPLARYYRSPLRYYRKVGLDKPGKGADE